MAIKRNGFAPRPCAPLLCLIVLGACGGGGSNDAVPAPPPPATVSLAVTGNTDIEESGNPRVELMVELDAVASATVSVNLNFAGSATRDSDYAVEDDSVMIPAGASSGSVEIDVYRDFDDEGDETIEISLGAISGNAEAGTTNSIMLTVLDGAAATAVKMMDDDDGQEINLDLEVLAYTVTEDSVQFAIAAIIFAPADAAITETLVAEWSTDYRFEANVHEIGSVDVESADDPFDLFFGNLHIFRVPTSELAPDQVYYVRAYFDPPPPPGEFGYFPDDTFFEGFATDSEGRVRVRCEAPQRDASGGGDPLYFEQWHLVNTGQTAFSDAGGVAGADLQMSSAIAAGRGGDGVKLAVIDTGLETCHPDLSANAAGRGSYNFAYERLASVGARPGQPYYFGVLGDHGTSVAGVAAAVANNGLGGRGVAPDVTLVGFNPEEASIEDEEEVEESPLEDPSEEGPVLAALLQSLGGSESEPDSASVDIFNMSFGIFRPGENSDEEFARLFRMGANRLRGGRGALYVKAAGNDFDFCRPIHPLNEEIGCDSSHADPDQNLPWLISVGGFNADDVRSSYSSAGANLWIVGPSGEDGDTAPAIITTDQVGTHGGYSEYPENRLTSMHSLNTHGDYVSAFGGTSSAAPAAAGAMAILLEVNPDLTWRDIKHILARTARLIDPDRGEVRAAFNGTPYVAQHAWQTNAAGYTFHNWYGFGALDVDAAVAEAMSYMPDSLGTLTESDWMDGAGPTAQPLNIPDADGAGVSASLDVSGLPGTATLEAVVLEISVDHPFAADVGITLRSPGGTTSVVNPPFSSGLADSPAGIVGWRLLSNAFYGENPNGTWTVHLADLAAGDVGSLGEWRLRFYYGEHP